MPWCIRYFKVAELPARLPKKAGFYFRTPDDDLVGPYKTRRRARRDFERYKKELG